MELTETLAPPATPIVQEPQSLDRSELLRRVDVDDGYVQLVDFMGAGDLSVVNAARVSFGKRKEVLDEGDIKLIRYLARHKHMSPFRHMQFTFLIHTSEVVCRQLYKHQVGCSFTAGEFKDSATVWNEISGRYVQFGEEFHKPSKFRKQHKSNKQASLPDDIVDENDKAMAVYEDALTHAFSSYKQLLSLGVCKEQARMVLPVSFMNTLTWTASLEAVVNFIRLRDHEGAQLEIRKLAQTVQALIEPICPHSLAALMATAQTN
jgi:thymidylate synthase (FAD)